ncbi:MAG TPA: bifunctional serine/threonine-protein kinase/formylglycine-generating enzyme family protein [Blastocatellia bacterium]|nr:bifunctional serine/threonine-protein kinase/formylglycine-generating enzyme family protein [Blastocatellia bacterium]
MNLQVKGDPYKLVGAKLERYEIQELIGIGGMGAVYRAQHEITKAKVAIKVLRPDLTISNEEGVGFFFEEATKTVSLQHPMIVKVINADYTPNGSAYMVMEWLDGRTLDQEIKERGAFSLQRVIVLLEQVAEAVAYAHKKRIIHRDLKPSNIMLVREENGEESIRVLDFGIAKVLSTTIGIGTNTRVAGTSYYISPEQTIAQSPIDQSADIYSLGVILYQLLTGQVPFEADTDGQVMDMHRSILPRPLREIHPDIPQAIEDVVLKALSKRPLDRFQSATDFARAFRHAANIALSELMAQCVDATSGAAVSQAEVYMNGKYEGQTGADGWWRKEDMKPRQYLIEVESPRYVRFNRSVDLQPNEELTVVAKLERKQIGELIVSCNAPDAGVEIAGRIVGETDQNGRFYLESIDAGSYVVRLSHPKYLPAETTVTVEVWKQAYAPFQLEIRPRRDLLEPLKRTTGLLAKRSRNSASSMMRMMRSFAGWGAQALLRNRRWVYVGVAATAAVILVFAIIFWQGDKDEQISENKAGSPSSEPPPPVVPTPPEGMIYIPGGTFQMGYDMTSRDLQSGPPHQVTVEPFFIDKYEVTIEAYQKNQNPTGQTGQTGQTEQTGETRLPMTGVTWGEADIHCRSLGKRLPTEEEWEFAARGTDGRLYPWGNSFEPGRANIANIAGAFTGVGSFPRGNSPFGVSDMTGNAMEWTDSDFKVYERSVYRPAGCSEPCKVIRGGAYFDQPQDATAVFRREYEPSVLSRRRNAYAVLGFRCAKEITR